jgi:hypothetical protein
MCARHARLQNDDWIQDIAGVISQLELDEGMLLQDVMQEVTLNEEVEDLFSWSWSN